MRSVLFLGRTPPDFEKVIVTRERRVSSTEMSEPRQMEMSARVIFVAVMQSWHQVISQAGDVRFHLYMGLPVGTNGVHRG